MVELLQRGDKLEQNVIYQVDLVIDNEIFTEYYQWLLGHVKIMLSFPGFLRVEIYEPMHQAKEQQTELRLCYSLASKEALEAYLQNHAAQMREEGIKKFGKKFSAARSDYLKLGEFNK